MYFKQVYRMIRKLPLVNQSPNCIKKNKNKIKYGENDFFGGWNSYTLQCGTIVTLISSGDCILQYLMWLWNRDSEFTNWQQPAM